MLFLHGYLSSGNSFCYQRAFFERDYNVFCPDLKGFGGNLRMEYPYSLSDYVDEVGEYLYKNGLKRPHVVAHSFGGRVVIKGVSEKRLDLSKIVLVGAAGLKPKFSLKKALKKSAFHCLKGFIPKEKLKGFYSSDYLQLPPVMKESFVKIVGEHLDGSLKHIDNDTLIVFGGRDRETPVYMAKRLNKGIKNSRLILLEGAGHFCFIEQPLKFNVEVREFLLS